MVMPVSLLDFNFPKVRVLPKPLKAALHFGYFEFLRCFHGHLLFIMDIAKITTISKVFTIVIVFALATAATTL